MQTDYIVCLIVARVGSQTLMPWWHASSVHELQQAVFLPCMFPERGPSEPQDGDGNGMQLRFDRRAPKTCQKRLKESKLLKEYGENSQQQSNQTSASIFRITKRQGKHGTTYFFCNMFSLMGKHGLFGLGL